MSCLATKAQIIFLFNKKKEEKKEEKTEDTINLQSKKNFHELEIKA